ncbi:MAG: HTH domain-containing protein, partial [Oscillospiraceae bacterium]
MIKNEILQALQESGGAVVSGGDLAAKLHVSRTAVWKQMVSLQNEGYRIQSVANKGYRLTESDVFSAHEIERRLTSTTIGHPIVFLDTVNSTTLYAKTLAANGA